MEVVVCADAAEAARVAADAVATLVRRRPDCVLGLATGSSPLGLYAELARRHREEGLSFARARAFLLDEYVSLAADHPQSYRSVIRRELTGTIDIADDAVHGPDGTAEDLPAECERYERALSGAGGVDLQVLGIGGNGHLGFNEPSSSLASRTRLKTLTRRTRADNARFFGSVDDVPRHVLTQGLATIRQARHLVLLASGEAKARAVAAAVEGPVSARCPASVLQLHPHASVLLDPAAASRLADVAYYREVWEAKPDWQGL